MPISGDYKVELVQVLFRHGARTCVKNEILVFPDVVDHKLHETYGYQQLTNYGKAQMYRLGQALRERYDNFLDVDYHPRTVYARSTDLDRTKMSLQMVLAGLFPASASQSWADKLHWQPVPFYALPRELDFLLLTFEKPKYVRLLEEAKKTLPMQEKLLNFVKFSDKFRDDGVKALIKYPFSSCLGMYNVINSHKTAKSPIPDWCTEEFIDSLRQCIVTYLDSMSLTVDMKKLISGPLVKTIVNNMNIDEKMVNPRKIYLYSAHEFNVAAFMRAHNLKDLAYPDFGSAVVVEKLRDSKGQMFVRLLAWTGKDDIFFPVKFEKYGEICPVQDYVNIVKDIIPSEDEELNSLCDINSADVKKLNTTDFVFRSDFVP